MRENASEHETASFKTWKGFNQNLKRLQSEPENLKSFNQDLKSFNQNLKHFHKKPRTTHSS